MNPSRFAALLGSNCFTMPRRVALGGLLAALTTLAGRLAPDHAAARKKRKNKNKNKQKRRKKSRQPIVGDGRCDPVNSSVFSGARRFAQTFFPPQSGRLDAAEVVFASNPADFGLAFEIFGVDAAGIPTGPPLATAIVIVDEATARSDPPKTVAATFARPVPLVLGKQLALAVTGALGDGFSIQTNSGNPCPDGKMYVDLLADGKFLESGGGTADLVYALTITDS